MYTPNLRPYSRQAADSPASTSGTPSATVWVLSGLGHRQNPSWCLAVTIIPFIPAAAAVAAHCRQSSCDGWKRSSGSEPVPHSNPLKVFGPKWQNMFISICCHSSCSAVGTGPKGAGGRAVQAAAASNIKREQRFIGRSIFCRIPGYEP